MLCLSLTLLLTENTSPNPRNLLVGSTRGAKKNPSLGNDGPQYENEKGENILGQNGLKGLQMVQFKSPRHPTPSVSSNFEVG